MKFIVSGIEKFECTMEVEATSKAEARERATNMLRDDDTCTERECIDFEITCIDEKDDDE